jgi:hypothetical protein
VPLGDRGNVAAVLAGVDRHLPARWLGDG